MNLLFDSVCPHGFVVNGYKKDKLINEFKKHQNKIHIDLGNKDYIHIPTENQTCFLLYGDFRQLDGGKQYTYLIDLDNTNVRINNISEAIIRFAETHLVYFWIKNDSKRKLTEKEKETLTRIQKMIKEDEV